MSKYDKLWRYVQCIPQKEIQITFERSEEILGFPINHSFLNYKKSGKFRMVGKKDFAEKPVHITHP